MDWIHNFFIILELLGTISFAISGSMTAIKKETDFFGVLFLGVLTAVGGGIFRDMILGIVPPTAFIDRKYVIFALLTSIVLFFIVRRHQEEYLKNQERVDNINNIVDAIGLGVFTVIGVQTTQSSGQDSNLLLCLFLGLITGIGGGLLRDIIVNEIPFVLKKRVYAFASLSGAFFYLQIRWFFPEMSMAASIFSVLLVFTIRMLATYFHWDLPKAVTKKK